MPHPAGIRPLLEALVLLQNIVLPTLSHCYVQISTSRDAETGPGDQVLPLSVQGMLLSHRSFLCQLPQRCQPDEIEEQREFQKMVWC